MILFFGHIEKHVFVVETNKSLSKSDLGKLIWLFEDSPLIEQEGIDGPFIGPRAAMITPWSTNAVEITQNMGMEGIERIEQFISSKEGDFAFDPMLNQLYQHLNQEIFTIDLCPEPIFNIDDISVYNASEGLSLSDEEVKYLETLSKKLGRRLTDSEVFGFSQVNSEHCRHKIFNGKFIIDEEEKENSLFDLIKKTSKKNPNEIVSAYKDNVAFIKGPKVLQLAPVTSDKPDVYEKKKFESVISLKAETHNFPTTVEPFNGAATGSGGEIRDRMAGGQGSIPLAGTAVYMTAYPRFENERSWVKAIKERKWLYQTPLDILIKASNGASDFGNKFGQPLISGSLLTFEYQDLNRILGYDKVIMMAGGVGYGKAEQAIKRIPRKGDQIVVMGGDNYRIGMGGAAVSSADTGEFSSGIELNAVQRSNPEMQKRVSNVVRAMVENENNPIVSIHDHGAGGHLNCLSELVEAEGGRIELDSLPVGDPTLSKKEIIGNESQERMGLVISKEHLGILQQIALRERAPLYVVGEITGDGRFSFESEKSGEKPMDLSLEDMFGSSPKTVMSDTRITREYVELSYSKSKVKNYIESVLRLEAVACKDWLTNKVDRCVGGRVAKQQCCGPLQLPLNNCGVMALDYDSPNGIATSIGHAPISGLIDAESGARNAIGEALTNLIWAPLEKGIQSVSLSANWMWPCKNPGEDARLYDAVESISDFAIQLGINIPTGKDSLSMKQKYSDGEVIAPGTVIISSVAACNDIKKVVEPVWKNEGGDLYYIDFSKDAYKLGGSSFAQICNRIGNETPTVKDSNYFASAFNVIQDLISNGNILAGHDISSGGLLTTLLELSFASPGLSANIDLSEIGEVDTVKLLFSENCGIVFQSKNDYIEDVLREKGIDWYKIGKLNQQEFLNIKNGQDSQSFHIETLRDIWFETSYFFDQHQCGKELANKRYQNYKKQHLNFVFPDHFSGKKPALPSTTKKPKAAILREQGSNSERELANAMHLAGFEVRDIHMTDLISGRETLEDIQFLGAVGGFSNSDVLGSAKGWAGSFLYNEKAKKSLENFFLREDVLSVGICNGCQLFMELGLINPDHRVNKGMALNDSKKHESNFTSVDILENKSIMLSSLAGCRLGVWISHGEGKFQLPHEENEYHIVAKYGYDDYPSNPNGSDYNTAMMANSDGRHLVLMPHIERSIFQWNWAYYPEGRDDEVSPWIEAFTNARKWLETLL